MAAAEVVEVAAAEVVEVAAAEVAAQVPKVGSKKKRGHRRLLFSSRARSPTFESDSLSLLSPAKNIQMSAAAKTST